MEIQLNEKELTVVLDSEIDASNANSVREELMEYLTSDDISLTLDAKNLTYISSAGLKIMVMAQKKLKNKISVVNISKHVMEIFEIAGFQYLMNLQGVGE